MSKLLKEAIKLRSMSENDVRDKLGDNVHEEPESDYQGLDEVLELRNKAKFPGRIFLSDGQVRLVYLSDEALEDVSVKDFDKVTDGAATELRSRAGKMSTLYLFAEDGVAYSTDGSVIDFAEFFPPCSADVYTEQIYDDPGPFRR